MTIHSYYLNKKSSTQSLIKASYKIEKNLYHKFIEHIEKNVQFEIVRERIKFHDIKPWLKPKLAKHNKK